MFWIHGTRYKRAPAGDLPIVDNQSLIDACWIKAYNGVPQNHFYYLDEGDNDATIPTQWRIDDQATYETENGESTNHYVRDIGETDTP